MSGEASLRESLGVVAIGRNEGPRLTVCLQSLRRFGLTTVYVDSGSTDDSVSTAEGFGVVTWPLDPSRPFTASRARREGLEQLLVVNPGLRYVFFIDGDCEVDADWPAVAVAALDSDDGLAAVAGRRREKCPEASWYNRLCDIEWDTPVGGCSALGGDGVYRVEAYRQAGGFDPTVPAGEEPELCHRLQGGGWRLERLDTEMTRHDAAMTRFGQWVRRQVRTGYGGADVEHRFRLGLFDRLIRGAVLWTVGVPALLVLASTLVYAWRGFASAALALVAIGCLLVLQVLRVASSGRRRGLGWGASLGFGFFTMLAKPPIALGALQSWIGRQRGRRATIIEYKGAASAGE